MANRSLLSFVVAVVVAMSAGWHAFACGEEIALPKEIVGVRKNLTCEGCLELFTGSILGSGRPKTFVGARRVYNNEERVWLGFTSPESIFDSEDSAPYVGVSYVSQFLFSRNSPQQRLWDPSKKRTRGFIKGPFEEILRSIHLPFFFPHLWIYLGKYEWEYKGKDEKGRSVLVGERKLLPNVTLKVKGRQDVFLIEEMTLEQYGMRRNFMFKEYREIQSGTYRPLTVKAESSGGKNVVEFDGWYFSIPDVPEARFLEFSNLDQGRLLRMPDPDSDEVFAYTPQRRR